ncbi:MAG TPA: hypothetical protein VFV66_27925, partial [Nonomuraea sp.]|nr:hypothetical protein [Nonomuraea sp.]
VMNVDSMSLRMSFPFRDVLCLTTLAEAAYGTFKVSLWPGPAGRGMPESWQTFPLVTGPISRPPTADSWPR